jgi:hypothetical protein
MPRAIYTQQYKALVEKSTLHDNPTLANLTYVLWQAVCAWVAENTLAVAAASPSGCLLSSVTIGATAALLYFITGSHSIGRLHMC